jgi:hypothetical protein
MRSAKCAALIAHLASFSKQNIILPDLRDVNSATYLESVTELFHYVKSMILEQDIGRLFSTNERVSMKLNSDFKKIFPDLDDQSYRALLRECSPAIQVMNDVLRQTIDYVNRLASNDPDLNIFELGLARYFIADGVFSLRTSHSISLAESQLTKWLLYSYRKLTLRCPLAYESLEFETLHKDPEFYHPDRMRAREKYFRVKRVKNKLRAKFEILRKKNPRLSFEEFQRSPKLHRSTNKLKQLSR